MNDTDHTEKAEDHNQINDVVKSDLSGKSLAVSAGATTGAAIGVTAGAVSASSVVSVLAPVIASAVGAVAVPLLVAALPSLIRWYVSRKKDKIKID